MTRTATVHNGAKERGYMALLDNQSIQPMTIVEPSPTAAVRPIITGALIQDMTDLHPAGRTHGTPKVSLKRRQPRLFPLLFDLTRYFRVRLPEGRQRCGLRFHGGE